MTSYPYRDDIRFDFRSVGDLMVDRCESFADILAQMLLGFGFQKIKRCAAVGGPGDEERADDPDFVLIDPLPDCDKAMAFIEDLRRRDREAGQSRLVIVVTGAPNTQVVAAARQAGADYVLAKPFSAKTLLQRILWVADPKASPLRPGYA